MASSLQRVEPFVKAVMEQKASTEVIAAVVRKTAPHRGDSDVQDEFMQDNIATLDDKTRLARDNLDFAGMDEDIDIGD